MATPTTTDGLLALVRRSDLVEDDCLDACLDRLASGPGLPQTPDRLARALVRDGLVTAFQATQLLRGKWRGFFLGKYKLLGPLGSGGMGRVFLAEHRVMHRLVALKLLPPGQADDPGAIRRLQREAEAAAALDHPNIVKAYDIDEDGGLHFLVLEYVDGVSLQDLVDRQGAPPPGRAADYARQAALGLGHAHRGGWVHRDVKPGNLLVDRDGVVKVLDLGLARLLRAGGEPLTLTFDVRNVLGTADYLAPEQARDSHEVDARTDVYSLGCTLYFLLAGAAPFADRSMAEKLIGHQVWEPRPLCSRRPDVPPALAAVVARMMAKNPAHRYQTMGEVAEALAPWPAEAAPPAEAGPPDPGTPATAVPLPAGSTAGDARAPGGVPAAGPGPAEGGGLATPTGPATPLAPAAADPIVRGRWTWRTLGAAWLLLAAALGAAVGWAVLLLPGGIPAREVARHAGECRTVTLRVQAARPDGCPGRLLLRAEPDDRDRDGLTVVIAPRCAARLPREAQGDPQSYFVGKAVEVTGTIVVEGGRPRVVVEEPGAVRVVGD
jgi:hypothetical protein